MKKKIIIALAAGLALTGCFAQNGSEDKIAVVANEETPKYNVEQVRLANLQSVETLYFSYEQAGTTKYTFEKEGKLGNVYVKKGDFVTAGDMIASLDGYEQAKNDYESYTLQLETKQLSLDTKLENRDYTLREYDIMHKYGYMTDAEYKEKTDIIYDEDKIIRELEDEIAILQLRIEAAQKIYEGGAILASASGKITDIRRYIKADDGNDWWNNVTPKDVIATIADTGEAVFVCETEHTDRFEIGQTVVLTNNNNKYSTKVTKLEENKVILTPYSVDDSMYVGMQISYPLVIEEKTAVNVISKSSLHVSGEEYYVYIVGDDNLRQMRKVVTGISNSQEIEIVSGLETGDLVVKR